MSKPFVLLGLLIGVCAGTPLRAEEFPWCVEMDVFTRNCAFANRDECVATAKSVASPATGEGRCIRNPNYQPPAIAPKSGKAAPPGTRAAKPPDKPPDKPR